MVCPVENSGLFNEDALRKSTFFLCLGFLLCTQTVRAQSNVILRVMASNLTSGNYQRYETPGLHILKGLKPDIAALQEFNYSGSHGINTPESLREMVDTAFGAEFEYFRESGYSIPNGIVSRYPILESGSWVDSDTGVNDRGFAWARIDVPGTNDLYVVSVHLKASSSSGARRTAEAAELKQLISSNFPANAWLIVAGDMNISDESEGAVSTFAAFLKDAPVPADLNGDMDTNASRAERYDRVLVSPSMTNLLVPVVMPSHTFTNGLVFDSRVYSPLSDVPPVLSDDSGAGSMQHMAVVRDFRITLADTAPALPAVLSSPSLIGNQFQFSVTGSTGRNYIVYTATNPCIPVWVPVQTNTAPFTFSAPNDAGQQFFRSVPVSQ